MRPQQRQLRDDEASASRRRCSTGTRGNGDAVVRVLAASLTCYTLETDE